MTDTRNIIWQPQTADIAVTTISNADSSVPWRPSNFSKFLQPSRNVQTWRRTAGTFLLRDLLSLTRVRVILWSSSIVVVLWSSHIVVISWRCQGCDTVQHSGTFRKRWQKPVLVST